METLRVRQTEIEADTLALQANKPPKKARPAVAQKASAFSVEKLLRKLQFAVLGHADQIVQEERDLLEKEEQERNAALVGMESENRKDLDAHQRAERRSAIEDVPRV